MTLARRAIDDIGFMLVAGVGLALSILIRVVYFFALTFAVWWIATTVLSILGHLFEGFLR